MADNEFRFIPTCMGQIARWPWTGRPRRSVHPHVRGADQHFIHRHLCGHRFIPTCVGQMLRFFCCLFCSFRFIPTCVGQIIHAQARLHGSGRFIPTCVGQMHERPCNRALRMRFIPTCVGQILRKVKLLLDSDQLKSVEVYNGSSRVTMNFHQKSLLIISSVC